MADEFFSPVSEEEMKRGKNKARELRRSQWWKNQLGRGQCKYCQRPYHPSELTMDHVVPLVRGGKSSKSNVVTCCKKCNSQKNYLLPVEWEEYLERLGKEA